MGDLEQDAAPDVERELSHLRRDVERLSLRLRQETDRTNELEQTLAVEQSKRLEESGRHESASRERAARIAELEQLQREHDSERVFSSQLQRELGALRTELRWARIVSSTALAVVFLLAIWLVILAI